MSYADSNDKHLAAVHIGQWWKDHAGGQIPDKEARSEQAYIKGTPAKEIQSDDPVFETVLVCPIDVVFPRFSDLDLTKLSLAALDLLSYILPRSDSLFFLIVT